MQVAGGRPNVVYKVDNDNGDLDRSARVLLRRCGESSEPSFDHLHPHPEEPLVPALGDRLRRPEPAVVGPSPYRAATGGRSEPQPAAPRRAPVRTTSRHCPASSTTSSGTGALRIRSVAVVPWRDGCTTRAQWRAPPTENACRARRSSRRRNRPPPVVLDRAPRDPVAEPRLDADERERLDGHRSQDAARDLVAVDHQRARRPANRSRAAPAGRSRASLRSAN